MIEELPPIAPYQRVGQSRAEMARQLGISKRHLRRLLKAEREGTQDYATPAEGPPANDDLPWVELVDERPSNGSYYHLGTDELQKPPGPFRIGDGRGRRLKVQHAGNGKPVEQAKPKDKPSEAEFAKAHTRQRQAKRLTSEEVEAIKAKGKPSRRKRA